MTETNEFKNFDHHCIWLNHCICSENYKCFICLLFSSLLFGFCYLFCSTAFIICYHTDEEGLLSKSTLLKAYDSEENDVLWIISYSFNWFGLCLCMLTEIAILALLIFHCYLRCKGLTTYEFIQIRRMKKNNKVHPQEINVERQSQNDSRNIDELPEMNQIHMDNNPSIKEIENISSLNANQQFCSNIAQSSFKKMQNQEDNCEIEKKN